MRLNRRDLLRAAALAGGMAVAWPLARSLGLAAANEAAEALGASWGPTPFTLGVASGDPLPTSVVLWTRLAPEPLADVQPLPEIVQVDWRVSTDAAVSKLVASGSVAASALLGHSVHIPVDGLEPGRRYRYQFSALGKKSVVGRTRTAPVGPVRKVRFASLNCQDYQHGEYSGMREIAADAKLDFVVHLGDYTYETTEFGTQYTLDDYRKAHALYKSDPLLRAAHATHPWYLTWDDHEVVDNYSGTLTNASFMARRAASYQAWYENMPLRIDGADSALPDPQIYRHRQWGDLLELLILDLRQYRSAEDLADGTMLGGAQKAWLIDQIDLRSGGWHCWVNSIMLGQQLSRPGGDYMFTDQWDGFRNERKEILTKVHKAEVADFVTITGDWHSSFVQDLRPDFNDTSSPAIGTEFVAHSITSDGNGPDWNADNGPKMGAGNPHLQYFEGNRYGYDLYEVTPQQWTTHMRVAADRADPHSPMSTQSTWHVNHGKVGAYEDPATKGRPAQYRR